eukprot:343821-Hanusia_phi.AAC.1
MILHTDVLLDPQVVKIVFVGGPGRRRSKGSSIVQVVADVGCQSMDDYWDKAYDNFCTTDKFGHYHCHWRGFANMWDNEFWGDS